MRIIESVTTHTMSQKNSNFHFSDVNYSTINKANANKSNYTIANMVLASKREVCSNIFKMYNVRYFYNNVNVYIMCAAFCVHTQLIL